METIATKCSCGAVTVTNDNFSNSMPGKLFSTFFPMLELEKNEFGSCDYCVNHWGIDLCGCGSGEKVGECDGNFNECRNKLPAQTLMERKDMIWKF